MSEKIRIVIAGIGGVGGYFGGLLAKKYEDSDEIDIVFLARGNHLSQIQQNGLKVINKVGDDFIAKPYLATDNAGEIGKAEVILVCTKGYDLENTIEQLRPCMTNQTMILPLLNGVDGFEIIQKLLPENTVLQGCVYIASRIKEAGVIENDGQFQKLFFGLENQSNNHFEWLEKVFKDANMDATLSSKITSIVWEKFIFISPIATATSYFDSFFGELVREHEDTVFQLITEVVNIAKAKGIDTPPNIIEKTMTRLKSLPDENTTSMHRDFLEKPQNELSALTGYIVQAGKELSVETPTYSYMYQQLKNRKSR